MTHWFVTLWFFVGGSYSPMLIPIPLNSEEQCRIEGAKTGYPEMPPPSAPMETWPAKGWRCRGPK